jgi:hypothetical protein
MQTHSGEYPSKKRHMTPEESLKKKRKETYNKALMEQHADANSSNHFNHSYQSHNAFSTPLNPNLIPMDRNLFYGFDHQYYCDD